MATHVEKLLASTAKSKKRQANFYLDADTLDRFKKLAKEKKVSVSDYLQALILDELGKRKKS